MATQETNSMVSETSICNQALSWLGQVNISSLDERSKSAEWMKSNYAFIRDAVLEERMWTFATTKFRSDSSTQTFSDSGLYRHAMPIGWLAVYRCFRDPKLSQPVNFRVESGIIEAQETTIYMWGLQRIVDTNSFSGMFTQALAGRLAAEACIPLTENVSLQTAMWQLYGDKLTAAAARDGQQGTNDYITQSGLVNARYSGGLYGGVTR